MIPSASRRARSAALPSLLAALPAFAFGTASPVSAQLPRQGPAVSERSQGEIDALTSARALVTTGDTSGAIRLLRDATARHPKNGELWYAYGSLLSARTRPHWRKGSMPNGIPSMIIAAESSLAVAMRLSPDSAQYAISYGKHLWGTNTTSLSHAQRVQTVALSQLEGSDDSAAIAESADQLGIMMWRRFEPMIGRGRGGVSQTGNATRMNREAFTRYVADNTRPTSTMFGQPLLEEARAYFQRARIASPDNELYFRHEMMVLSERSQWEEIEEVARARIAQRPAQGWPWLVLGLSQHRRQELEKAGASFDSGYARLGDAERARFMSIENLLRSKQKKWYDTLSGAPRDQLHELFWNTADPSLLLPGNPMYSEFRARMVYAELRFTDDEKARPGSLTDKGRIFLRYGPPDVVSGGALDGMFIGMQTWYYANEMMQFQFKQNWGYGTAFMTADSWVRFDSTVIERPTAWTNLPILRHRIDSVSAQVVRFRAGADSMDVAVFAGIRTGALRRESPAANSSIRHGLIFVDALGREITRSTGVITSDVRDTTVMTQQDYFMRTTAKATAARIEAVEPDLMQLARSITSLSGFSTRGFGVSDLLIAARVTAPPRADARWNDYTIASLTGSLVPRGAPLSLLWESYEPAGTNGTARLRFAITVQREQGDGLVALASRMLGGIRGAVSGGGRRNGVTISYDREVAMAPVIVDHLQLDIGDREPGRYRVLLQVTDLTTNVTQTRTQRFTIVRR